MVGQSVMSIIRAAAVCDGLGLDFLNSLYLIFYVFAAGYVVRFEVIKRYLHE